MNWKIKVVLMVFSASCYVKSWAKENEMEPGTLPLGPFDLTPILSLREIYDDNIFSGNENTKASLITQILGGSELTLRRKLDRYALRYSFLSSQFHSSPADNFVDHNFGADAHFEITRRNRLDISSGFTRGHDRRGTFFSQGAIASQIQDPDQFKRYNANLGYRYGRIDAPGNLGLTFGWNRLEYINHRERTAQFDRSNFELTPGVYLRMLPKTYLTTQMENTLVDYDVDNGGGETGTSGSNLQDYIVHRYLVGVTRDQSAKLNGAFRIGYLQQEFIHSDRSGSSGLTWDGDITWSPLSYSSLNLGFSRNIQPTIGVGLSREVQVYSAGWTHTWPKRVTTNLNGSYQESTSQGGTSQSASGVSFGFDVSYAMRPWLDLGARYSYSDFQQDTNDFNRTKNLFMLYVDVF